MTLQYAKERYESLDKEVEALKSSLSGEVTGLKEQLLTMQTQLFARHSLDKLPALHSDDLTKRLSCLESDLKQVKLDCNLC